MSVSPDLLADKPGLLPWLGRPVVTPKDVDVSLFYSPLLADKTPLAKLSKMASAAAVSGALASSLPSPVTTCACAGQEEQWRRIARIRMHQIRKEKAGATGQALVQAEPQLVEAGAADDPAGPQTKHVAARIKQVFENIISSEELPRQPGSLGSFSDHLNNTGQKAASVQQDADALHSLQQVTSASLNADRPGKIAL